MTEMHFPSASNRLHMKFFERPKTARPRQSSDEKRLLGFSSELFSGFRQASGSRNVSVSITRISSTINARATPTTWDAFETCYEMEGVARIGMHQIPCEVLGWDEPQHESDIPANIVQGWDALRPYVTAHASLNGHYVQRQENEVYFEEVVPALQIVLPASFFRHLASLHLRTQAATAGFRMNAFSSNALARHGAREEWEWSRFVEWMRDDSNSASSWRLLAYSVVTWEHREFSIGK